MSDIRTAICRGCEHEFTYEGGSRGRPRTWCDDCREDLSLRNAQWANERKAKKQIHIIDEETGNVEEIFGIPLTGHERVSRLEIMLKARGTHISQIKPPQPR